MLTFEFIFMKVNCNSLGTTHPNEITGITVMVKLNTLSLLILFRTYRL